MKNIKKLQKRCIYGRKIKHCIPSLQKGEIGIVCLENSFITFDQISCFRLFLRRGLKKKGSVIIRCNLSIPITKKSSGVRMGKGKGDVSHFQGFLSKNECFIELSGVSRLFGYMLIKKLSYKIPFKIGLLDSDGFVFFFD